MNQMCPDRRVRTINTLQQKLVLSSVEEEGQPPLSFGNNVHVFCHIGTKFCLHGKKNVEGTPTDHTPERELSTLRQELDIILSLLLLGREKLSEALKNSHPWISPSAQCFVCLFVC